MDVEHEQRVIELLEAALECPAAERAAFLDAACGGQEAIRQEVEKLLDYDAADFMATAAFKVHDDPGIGREIGAYRTVGHLGSGGMASVYLAVREADFEQKVAVKLIKRGMDTDEIVRRFRRERQILADLADLHHPSIARILDGGTTPEGLPYFAMEYIEGEAIDRYCDTRRLSVGARLELFLEICSAVHTAHQHLVVHRDLKPSNILVTADGVPKLLDFGIAKLLQPRSPQQTRLTAPEQHLMTPLYASPEQVRGGRVTTASDLYSLGVLLYQLLTGHLPYRITASDPREVVRVVCEKEPKRPSTAVRQSEEIRHSDGTVECLTPESVSRARASEASALRRRLAGDLDSIVLKTLEKNPRRRYGSVVELAADIRRHLAGLPVHAHAGSVVYRAGKFARRNKLALAAALLVLSSSVATTVLWRQAVAAEAAAVRATAEAVAAGQEAMVHRDRAQEALALLKSSFKVSEPDRAKGEVPTALDILEDAKDRVEELADPVLKAEVLNTLGGIYRDLGRYPEARELLVRSLELRRRLYSGDHPELAGGINNLAGVLLRMGEVQEAGALYLEALPMRRRPGEEGQLARAMCNLATSLMGRGAFAQAEELYQGCLRIREGAAEPQPLQVARSHRSLGTLYYAWGRLSQAEPHLRRAHEIHLAELEPGHTDMALTLTSLGRLFLALGKLPEAEQALTQGLEIRRRRLGVHPHVALTETDLAELHLARGQIDRAEELLRDALTILRRLKEANAWEIANAESLLGVCLAHRGSYAEAEPHLVESYRRLAEARGPHAIYTRKALERVVDLYQAWGRPQAAERYRAVLDRTEGK